MGLVIRVPNKGSSVANPTLAEIQQRVQVRMAIEPMAMVNCAECMTGPDFDKAESLAMAIQNAVQNGSAADASKAGFNFHRFLWHCSGSPFLARTLEQVCSPLFAFHGLAKDVIATSSRGASEHLQILDVLRGKNADAIHAVVSAHVAQSTASMASYV